MDVGVHSRHGDALCPSRSSPSAPASSRPGTRRSTPSSPRRAATKELEGSGSRYVNLSRYGQVAWDHIQDVLKDLDYEAGIAFRWWPRGRDEPIVIDPRVSFGRPYVVRKGISTDAIRSRFAARESLDSIADDLDLTEAEAEAALRFELPAAA